MSTIRSLIFDIGNVLLPFDFGRALNRVGLQNSGRLTSGLPREFIEMKDLYETGRIERSEFLKRSIAATGYQGTEAEFSAAWTEIFDENVAMTRLVQSLHGRYSLYVLSNTSDLHIEYVEATYPVFQYFSDGVYSHIAGCIKPGREIFEIAIRQLGVKPDETIFIDDLPDNVVTARELGFHAFQYDYKAHHRLLEQLAALGVADVER